MPGGKGKRLAPGEETVVLRLRIPASLKARAAAVCDNISGLIRSLLESEITRREARAVSRGKKAASRRT
jgi:hypothetical protein